MAQNTAKQKGLARFHEFPPVIRDYLFYLETIKGRSKRTVDGYAIDLRTFFRFMQVFKTSGLIPASLDEIPIDQLDIAFMKTITLSDIYEFLNYSLDERQNNPNTRSRKVSSIRGFFKYLTVKANLLEENPAKELEMPSVKKTLPVYLTLEQSLELLSSIDSKTPKRDFCILVLFLNCGMRLSELVGINLSDIRDDTLRLLGKGNKERIVYLNDACKDAIAAYRDTERNQLKQIVDKNALFLSSRTGKRLGGRMVEKIVEEALQKAGLSGMGYSPHKLRHTAATLMYQHGEVDIRVLKDILGHANLGTTEIYTHVSNANMETAAKKNPLSKVKPKK